MARLFGTDGVRGLANRDVTAELALDLSVAAARVLGASGAFHGRPRAVVGRDPRSSGEFLSAAVVAGLASAGVDVEDVGVLPTPAVAFLTAEFGVDLGVVLSASHNPMPDNGIKFLARGGHKLDDELEDAIEGRRGEDWDRPTGAQVGRVTSDPARAARHYVQHLVRTIDADLSGLRIAMDCANGAASEVGPAALRAAGAEVLVINAAPDGRNINALAGSTHPEQLQAFTVAAGADFGVAFDGDADRCLAIGPDGALVDGDQIMGVLALALHEKGELVHDTLVITVMSNLGLRLAMREHGITTIETAVGDRYVLEAMRANGYVLGGEQSGHIILAEHATTGDGILTAMQLAARVASTGRSLTDLAGMVRRLPQTLLNVSGVDRTRVAADDDLARAIADVEAGLGETGRVLLRPSGTEPVVRVMVEAATQDEADRAAATLAGAVRERLAL